MIDGIKNWLWGLVAASLCLAVLHTLLPKGAVRSIGRISGGLVLLLVIVQPLTGLRTDDLRLRYADYQQQIDRQIRLYRDDYEEQLRQRIEEETSAYISEKAAQMGIDCQVQVKTAAHDGVSIPNEVTLDIPKDEVLAAWIAAELGIGQERQYWEDTE